MPGAVPELNIKQRDESTDVPEKLRTYFTKVAGEKQGNRF